MPLLVVLAGLFAPGRWSLRTRWLAGVAGWLGLALTAALASLVSLFLGVLVLFALAWRHRRLAPRPVVGTLLILTVVVASTLTFRHNDLAFAFKWFGKQQSGRSSQFSSSWHQRLIYVYVGGRIFIDHPLAGTGWWGQPPFDVRPLRAGRAEAVSGLPTALLPSARPAVHPAADL